MRVPAIKELSAGSTTSNNVMLGMPLRMVMLLSSKVSSGAAPKPNYV